MATEADIASPAGIAMRAYFSSYHLWAAQHFTRLATELETTIKGPQFDLPHRSYVTNAVFSAVAFIEAAINEVFEDVNDRHPSYVGVLDPESHKKLAEGWAKGKNRR